MINRITKRSMDAAFERYSRAVDSLGMNKSDHRLAYMEGSKVNGVSHKLVWIHVQHGGYSGAPGTDVNGFIGMTKREAYETMSTIARALEDVAFRNYELGMEA